MPNKKQGKGKKQGRQVIKVVPVKKPSQAYRTASKVASRIPGMLGLAASGIVEGINAIGGFGDYTVGANTITTRGTSGIGVPQFQVGSSNRITHRECIGTLVSNGTGFAILKTLLVNPSNNITFPWLSAIAGNYILYDVHGMVVIVETNSSDYSATSALGTVCVATRYDSREPAFSSMIEMQNSMFAVSAKPSHNIIHPIECKKGFQPTDTFYVRRGNESEAQYNYDKCTTYIGVEGLQAAAGTVIGRVWISYDIEFKSPALPVSTTPNVTTSKSTFLTRNWGADTNKNAVVFMGQGMTPNTNMQLGQGVDVGFGPPLGSDNPPVVIYGTGKYIRFYQPGTYVVSWNISGTGLDTSQEGEVIFTPSNNGSINGFMVQVDPDGVGFVATQASYTYLITIKGTYDGNNSYYQLLCAEIAVGSVSAASAHIVSHASLADGSPL